MLPKAQNRWQAFGVHLFISLLLFLILAAIIYFLWYPGFLFQYDGGLEGVKLIAGVDLIIGPVLTLCVYRLGKASLRFDLSAIALLQAACIAGGMWAVWQTRPIAVVYAAGEYATVNAIDFESESIKIADVPILQGRWPLWLAVNLPDKDAKTISMTWGMVGKRVQMSAENYVPYANYLPHIVADGMPAADIKQLTPEQHATFADNKNLRFYSASLRFQQGYMVVDTRDGKAQAFLPTHTDSAANNRKYYLPPVWMNLADGSGLASLKSYACKLQWLNCK